MNAAGRDELNDLVERKHIVFNIDLSQAAFICVHSRSLSAHFRLNVQWAENETQRREGAANERKCTQIRVLRLSNVSAARRF